MKIKPIKTNEEYQTHLDWVDKMFDKKVSKTSEEGEKLEVILLLIKAYEDKHYPIPVPDPIEAVKLKMREKNLKNKDLVGLIGSKGHVSAVLNKKKLLTIQLARTFYKVRGILAEVSLS